MSQVLFPARRSRRAAPAVPTSSMTINVALYPYLPRLSQFQTVLQNAWNALYPTVDLNFVNYDCYSQDPDSSTGLDVFVFDSIFLSYFVSQGYLMQLTPAQIDNPLDFMGYTLAASKLGSTPYGIPYLGCVSTFYSRAGDMALDQALSLSSIYQLMGDSSDPTNPQPPPDQGLLIDFTGGTTDACLYLQTVMEISDSYPTDPDLPPPSNLNQNSISNLQQLVKMAGLAQAQFDDPGFDRVNWFSGGLGRAFVGVTETLCSFPPTAIADVNIRVLPLSDMRIGQPFYVDLVSVSAYIDPAKTALAIELANLMASAQVMYASMVPDKTGDNPQYLIPARGSVFAALIDLAPKYQEMADIVLFHVDYPFQIGAQSRPWLNSTKTDIRNAILNIPGGPRVLGEMFDDTRPGWEELSHPVNLFRKK